MAFSKPSTWVKNHVGLHNVLNHHLFTPADIKQHLHFMDTTSFEQGARQFFFWKNEMSPTLPENTIILAFLGPEGLKDINVVNVMEALNTIIDMSTLLEVYQGAHTAFFGLSFQSPATVSTISKLFLYFNDAAVLHITHSSPNLFPFRLLWLPPLFPQDRVHHLLSTLTSYHSLRRENLKTSNTGTFSPTNILRGLLSPKPGVNVKDLPHLISLPAPHKGSVLLSITGRDPICLKCREIGHLRKNCTLKKCTSCNKVHFASDACGSSSYASLTSKNLTRTSPSDWLALAMDIAPSVSDDTSSSTIVNNIEPATITSHLQGNSPYLNDSTPVQVHPSQSDDDTIITSHSLNTNVAAALSSLECDHILLESVNSLPPDPPPPDLLASKAPLQSFPTTSLPSAHSTTTQFELDLPSPPVTRSRSSHQKRLKSSNIQPHLALRSEIIDYTVHDASLQTSTSISTTHAPDFNQPSYMSDVDFESDVSAEEGVFSDISVDLSQPFDPNDIATSRKRNSSHFSTLETDDSPPESPHTMASPLLTALINTSSPESSQEPLLIPHKNVDSTSPTNLQSELSEADQLVAAQLCLSPQQLLTLKQHIPDNTFSNDTLRRLRLLASHGIPLLNVINHPAFFTIPIKTLAQRAKSLSQKQSTPISIEDITLLINKSRSLI